MASKLRILEVFAQLFLGALESRSQRAFVDLELLCNFMITPSEQVFIAHQHPVPLRKLPQRGVKRPALWACDLLILLVKGHAERLGKGLLFVVC